jgi:hypothetical protein
MKTMLTHPRPAPATKAKPREAKKPRAPKGGVRAQPLVAVRDVGASTRWYAKLLDVRDPDGYVVVIASRDGEAEGA